MTVWKLRNNTRNLSSTTWDQEKDLSAKGKQHTLLWGGMRTEGSVMKYELKALAKDFFLLTIGPSAFL